ncbi:hypothetical protein [Deinococcus sp. 12RED42]|uniref:hypothetical protein n=1 Tax=Deinococcus sp. 12RED42 TaxID=2745872 RepID=UPI001E3137E3|nr:hypothetical protein [Deinococcus sp. 12RED42]MCD0165919.1 hypothetical protein [Deinococcus sp. 12RED42]
MFDRSRQNRENPNEIETLRIFGNLVAPVVDIADFLDDLDECYKSIGAALHTLEEWRYYERYAYLPAMTLSRAMDGNWRYLYDGELLLGRASFNSPGFWDFLGKLNILEVIRIGINDRWTRKKEAQLLPYEQRRLELENNILESRAIAERISVLRQAGIREEAIREVINNLVIKPLDKIERYQDHGIITDSTLVSLGENGESSNSER